METWDLVVLGGGLAGLTAAALAARAGRRVLLCERQGQLGGRAATDSEGGYALNLGPHALFPGGAAFRTLQQLGIELRGAPPRVTGYAVFEGDFHTLPAGPVSLLTTSLLPAAAKWEMGRLLGSIGGVNPAFFHGKSADDVVSTLATHPRSRALLRAFLRLSTYCEDTGQHCGATALAQLQRSARSGVFYVEGGWQTMVDRLAGAAREAGAHLRGGASVDRVTREGSDFLVSSEAETIRARSLLLTAGPRTLARLLGEQAPSLAALADRAEPLRGACLDVALSSVPRPEVRTILGVDCPCFGALQSETVRLAPEGGGVVHLIRYLRAGERPTPEHHAELEALLDGMQPGWRSLAVRQRWMPNLITSNARVEAGAGLAGRPGVEIPELPGAFLAGDWVGAEGILVDASFASASEAASRIISYTAKLQERAAA